jgi:hypothetical protein
MQIELSSDGVLKKPSLHDGHFYGIVSKKGEPVRLMTEDHKNAPFLILLENAGLMNVTNFWGGDIILEISLLPVHKAPSHVLRGLFLDRITDDKKIADAISKDGRKYLFVLECSYGADVYITCDQMQIVAG